MKLTEKSEQVFKQYFLLGAGTLAFGLVLAQPHSISWLYVLMGSLMGGFVIGYCFKSIFENLVYCTLSFYEYTVKLQLENGRSSRWRSLLLKRLVLSSLSTLLIMAVLILPVFLQLSHNHFRVSYFLPLGILGSRLTRFIRGQIRGSKAIHKRSLEVDELLNTQ